MSKSGQKTTSPPQIISRPKTKSLPNVNTNLIRRESHFEGNDLMNGKFVERDKTSEIPGGGLHHMFASLTESTNTTQPEKKKEALQTTEDVTFRVSSVELDRLFAPLMRAILTVPLKKHNAAVQMTEEMKREIAKGRDARYSVINKLIDGLNELAPGVFNFSMIVDIYRNGK
jgi:hypothetical protein